MNELDALFADARESLVRLTVNPLCARDHAEKLVREDAAAILDKLWADVQAHLSAPTDYLTQPEGGNE